MSKPLVLVTRQIPDAGLDLLRAQCQVALWEEDSVVPRDWVLEHILKASGMLCLLTDAIDREVLDAAPSLKVVSTMAVGFDNIDVKECSKRGISVGHTPGILTETTADFAFALLMAAARRIVDGAEYVKEGHWKTWSPTLLLGQDMYGATLGIVGFGRIGQAVARRAKGFGMRVLACRSTTQTPIQGDAHDDVKVVDLPTVLTESDFVSLHVPLTQETHHLIGKPELERMKNSAILVNTSRGSVIDSQALALALAAGDIAYASLDVTDPEPIPLEHPLFHEPHCLIVPHIASASFATRGKMAIMAAENLLAGLNGKRLPFVVNPEVYA
ncbi:MAG: D-glycerate dehydrogenase [Nitrospirales bacterium]|nr:MAG: D-glycerate dehydrogenase [Nitrospirales bacterium]